MTFFVPKTLKTLALGLLAALALAPSAHALVTFDLGGTAGNASSYTYTKPPGIAPALTVTGLDGSSSANVNRSLTGLGVNSGLLDDVDVDDTESLVLTFASTVNLYGWDVTDNGIVSSSNKFRLYVDGIDKGLQNLVDVIANPSTILFTGTVFRFRSDDDSFRLNAVTVPEPESVALVLAGLAVVGFVGARRKQAA